jgi:outer membrane protein OmpU
MNIKKVGLTALAGSLVAASAYAGEMSVAGSASLNVEHTNGGAANSGKTFSMGNQLTFSGSGELDNGLTVSLSFVLDQNDDATLSSGNTKSENNGTPFDSHSVTISSESLGSLKFSGEGGSSATSAADTTAAGDIWDNFDGATTVHPTGVGTGDNMMMYTTPSIMDGLSLSASYLPTGSAAESAVGYSATYTGVEGLSLTYASGDGTSADTSADALKASYAYGPVTVAYSNYEYDTTGTTSDDDTTSYKVSYTVSDEISVSYGSETVERPGKAEDGEYSSISASYTAGGMTITAAMQDADNMDGTTTATEDRERWALSASFAF